MKVTFVGGREGGSTLVSEGSKYPNAEGGGGEKKSPFPSRKGGILGRTPSLTLVKEKKKGGGGGFFRPEENKERSFNTIPFKELEFRWPLKKRELPSCQIRKKKKKKRQV